MSVIACMPVDRSQFAGIPEAHQVVITDLYTLKNCEHCEQPIWVGPRQLAYWDQMRQAVPLLDYACAAAFIQALTGEDPLIQDFGGGYPQEGRARTL